MISYLAPRRCGKTYKAVRRYLRLPSNAVYVTFNYANKNFIRYEIEQQLKDEENPIRLKNKLDNVMSYDEFKAKFKKPIKSPVIIDELPLILEKIFGNVDMFTGTTLRMDSTEAENNRPDDYLKEMAYEMSPEEYDLEILGEFYE